ncbi:transglutaminase domain-containing protein [Deinococcus sp. 14RED07]|uniref:transglutaminase-like domain-containing protein n=1 Tax=Deinococcus sp. 14RED07 TaxID=2745874 RepID=UPI001E592DEC|nr:transglutaminase-like domain-containing protein [Deinococcus sp. 14RED07]MCD0175654.1 transglutaminase domain-containing protein [Deinococcus sp. 14RED07]
MTASTAPNGHPYRYTVTYVFRPSLLGADSSFDVVCPLPTDDGYQRVEHLALLGPADAADQEVDGRGNALWAGQVRADEEIGFRAAMQVQPFVLGTSRLSLPGPSDADLQPATMVPLTAEIITLAQQLTAACTTPEARARTLFRYVRDTVRYQYPPKGRGAGRTLRDAQGDCGEYANLLSALCRAVGIPARPVMGWLCAPWFSGAHAWAEVWLEPYGWTPVDANLARESRYWGPLLGVPAHPEFYFGNLDGYRLVLSRGTQLAWPYAAADAAPPPDPQLQLTIDDRPVQFWQELVDGGVPYLQLPYTVVRRPRTGRRLNVRRLFSVRVRPRRTVLPPSLTAAATFMLQPRCVTTLLALGFASALLTPLLRGDAATGGPLLLVPVLLRAISDLGTALLLMATLAGFAMKRGGQDYLVRGVTATALVWVLYSLVLPRWGFTL